MAYFFPEPMTYCQALVPTEIAWDVLNQLGEEEKIMLQSNTPVFDNPYNKSYRRCEELLAKITAIRTILGQCKAWINFDLKEVKYPKAVWRCFRDTISKSHIQGYLYINLIEEEILTTHGYLSSQMQEIDSFTKRATDLIMEMGLLVTLEKNGSMQLFQGVSSRLYEQSEDRMFESKWIGIKRKDLLVMKRSIFRIARGNAWVNEVEISADDINRYFTSAKHRKLAEEALSEQVACFIVFPKGERGMILSKIDRLLTCLNCHVMSQERKEVAQEMQKREQKISDIEAMEDLTFEGIRKHISRLSEVKEGSVGSWLCEMELYARKEREIYRALSTTQVTKTLARFRLYIPSREMPLRIQPNKELPPLTLNIMESGKMPPSLFDSNCMMMVPQEIVNTYGVPSYHQINPAPFYIVTFGFFIGVMFGDVGHMLMAIPMLIYFKANLWFWTVIFWMGYCGLIYNEFFGLNLGLFPSCYSIVHGAHTTLVQRIDNCIYPLGVDSVWKVSFNEMAFTNSLKMKMAVIFGVTHMMFGLMLRLYNDIRQKKWLDFVTLTIPQIVFMTCTFVYMDFIIVYKWASTYPDTNQAPSIISTMIAIFVNLAKDNPKDLLFWPEERTLERIVVAIAFVCVPIMLITKPLVIYCRRRSKQGVRLEPDHVELRELHEENDSMELDDQDGKLSNEDLKSRLSLEKVKVEEHGEDEGLKEIIVHQFIETIEFVLGSVSNTASYLRLWALSLAHAQLSAVIFQLTVLRQLEGGYSSLVGLFLIFPFYLAMTFGVLICMDSLECFLHSLRLHWVQFQNKFYEGKGHVFNVFGFRKLK